ncbi:hypothetical protein ABW20_dc0106831 [Dactylellina cionopaga]|nr:hypothetical protein ABW20_dc0106831 [Dactylellina cionopaga]
MLVPETYPVSSGVAGDETFCPNHSYDDLYDINPVALRLIELVWKYTTRESDGENAMTLVEYLTYKTAQINYMLQKMQQYCQGANNQQHQPDSQPGHMNLYNLTRHDNLVSSVTLLPIMTHRAYWFHTNLDSENPRCPPYSENPRAKKAKAKPTFDIHTLSNMFLELINEDKIEWIRSCAQRSKDAEKQPLGLGLVVHVVGKKWRQRVTHWSTTDLERMRQE